MFSVYRYMFEIQYKDLTKATDYIAKYTMDIVNFYSESKYSVESVTGKYLENGWSDQHGDFSVEFVIEKLTTLFFCT